MKQEKSIETPELLIKGNIMSWEGMMIQLSNVSCISTTSLKQIAFPVLSVLVMIIGIVIFKSNFLAGIFLLLVGAAWIYGWYYINNSRKSNTILNIVMNSGNNLQILIGNKDFLNKVLKVLEQIIIEGGVGQQNISIDIRGCKITGNASVLNGLNL